MNKYADIIESILIERENQNVKHPVLPKYFLHPVNDPKKEDLERAANYAKADNDKLEHDGDHSWYGIHREELYETHAETRPISEMTTEDLHKMRAEAIQCAALYVRMIETIDGMIKEKEDA